MKNQIHILSVLTAVFIAAFSLLTTDATAVIVDVTASNDTSLYQGVAPNDPTGDNNAENNSCGGGPDLFTGVTANGDIRRALIKFDIAGSIPAGSTINSVTLTIDINGGADRQNADMTLHPVSIDWGEGVVSCDSIRNGGQGAPADLGDATWLSAKHDHAPAWGSPGGDFGAASASANIPPARAIGTWSSATNPDMVTDVQAWLDNPTTNFGWIVRNTNTDETRAESTRRFSSREGSAPPVLNIDWTPPPGVELEECCDVDGVFNGSCSLVLVGDCLNRPPVPNAEPTCSPNPCPQPIGACCNIDESCTELLTGAECAAAGGDFQGDGSTCSDNNVDCGLKPFVDPLPWPVPEVQPVSGTLGGEASYEITMSEVRQQLHSELPDTTVWGYQGSFPGPTLEATVDKPISVKIINDLPVRGHYLTIDTCPHGPNYWRDSSLTSIHLHGGHVPARFDGQPEYTFFPGEFDIYEYPNNQPPATLWYHDHALGITRLNVYMGLAAYYMIRPDCAVTPDDPECNGSLPPKEFEVPAVIQDRQFDEKTGDLIYPTEIVGGGFFGDKVLVNGKVWPYLNVNQGKYRIRLLNGSQARTYKLRLENLSDPAQVIPFHLIGTDVGLVSAPIAINNITMVPAERFDVVIDFADFPAGTEIVLRNDQISAPRVPNVMKFVVVDTPAGTDPPPHTAPLPGTLVPVDPIPESESAGTRWFNLVNVDETCAGKEWLIQSLDGPDPATATVLGEHWDDIDAYPVLGTTEIWEFINESGSMHPMHVHLVKFQILDRCPVGGGTCQKLAPHEEGTWKDTVRVSPGTRVRVIMRFEDYLGRFPAHCHLLDHEDHEMMRQFQTINDPANCDGDGQCEPGEDCVSCADCSEVSGALCGNGLCETGDGEDFFTCPEDCNGSDKGKSLFNCGSDDPNDPGYKCGFELVIDPDTGQEKPLFNSVLFDGCTTNGYFCRVAPRVKACCGDALCEGQETEANCAIDCAPLQPCTRNAPTFSLGADQSVGLNEQAVYTLTITNNDTASCSDSTFNLSVIDEAGNTNSFILPSSLSTPQVTVSPQTTDFTVTLTVQSNGDGADGEFLDTTVEARDDTHHLGQEQTDTVRTTIQIGQANCDGLDRSTCRNTPGCEWVGGAKSGTCQVVSTGQCTYNDQSVTISPTAQDIKTDGGSTVYTVNVTNNDTVACAATTFNLFVTDSDTGENFVAPSILGLNSVTLDPGASQNVDLTVTGQAGAPNGAVNNTSVTAADPASNHVNVTSNTVTTTINLGGPVNCSMYMDKQTCNNDPNCKWRSQECQPR